MRHVVDEVALQAIQALGLAQPVGRVNREEDQDDHQDQVGSELNPHVAGQLEVLAREMHRVELDLLEGPGIARGNPVALLLKPVEQVDVVIPQEDRTAIAVEQGGTEFEVDVAVVEHRTQQAVGHPHGPLPLLGRFRPHHREAVGHGS